LVAVWTSGVSERRATLGYHVLLGEA